MKVLFLTEFYPSSTTVDVRGGVELRTYYTSQGLAAQHRVTVVAVREMGMPARQQVKNVAVQRPGPIGAFRQAGGYLTRLRFGGAARKVIFEQQPDVIVAENFLAYAVMLTMPSRLRKKTFLTYHDVWIGEWIRNVGLIMGLIGEVVERLVFQKQWKGYISNSEVTRQKLLARGIHPHQVSVIPNGVDLAAIRAIVPESFDRPTIVTVARLVKYKRIEDLIRALPAVAAKVPNVQLVVIGTGPEEPRLKTMAASLRVQDRIVWRGFVPKYYDVLAAIKGATVFSLPSAVEGFGFVTLEAMACGTPYVSSDIPPTREVTNDGLGGALVPVGDIQNYERSILEEINKNKAFRNRDNTHVKHYDWSAILPNLIQVTEAFPK